MGSPADHVLLVHGWGGSFEATWQRNGFTALLEDGGKTVIGVDLLGHGTAPKPHDPDDYADLTGRVVDAFPAEPVAGIGFSLGAMTLLRAAIDHPDRFERLVVAGVGKNIFDRDHSGASHISEGLDLLLSGAELGDLTQQQRLFAQYARQDGNDLEALAAIMRRPPGSELSRDTLGTISCPVLVVVGEDDFVHPADELVEVLPDATLLDLPRTDHFATTDSFAFYDAALEFVGAL